MLPFPTNPQRFTLVWSQAVCLCVCEFLSVPSRRRTECVREGFVFVKRLPPCELCGLVRSPRLLVCPQSGVKLCREGSPGLSGGDEGTQYTGYITRATHTMCMLLRRRTAHS